MEIFFLTVNAGYITGKRILLIGMVDYSLIPYYACFASKVTTISTQEKANRYTSIISEKLQFLANKIEFSPYFKVLDEFIDSKKNHEEYDVILGLDKFGPPETFRLLEEVCPNGFLVLLNKNKAFEKRFLKKLAGGNLEQEYEILENENVIRQLLQGTD